MNSLNRRHLLLSLSLLVLPVAAQDMPKTAEIFDIAGNKAFVYAAPTPAAGKQTVEMLKVKLSDVDAIQMK